MKNENNGLENTINDLYNFFEIQPEGDMRDFSIIEFNQAYLRKLNAASTPKLKLEVKDKYNRLYAHVVDRIRNYIPPEENFTMVSFLDEYIKNLKNSPSSNYRSV